MIELPRACFVADRIAEQADFFSFGTNDLTQTALGFSRDDVGSILARYIELKIVDRSPFETMDTPASGGWCGWRPGPAARQAGPQARRLRRARRRPRLGRLLPAGGAGLRELLALPRADRPRGGGQAAPARGRNTRGIPDEAARPVRAPREDRAVEHASRSLPRSATPAYPAMRARPSPTRPTGHRSCATATGSSTPRPSGGSSTRPRCSSPPRATTTAPGSPTRWRPAASPETSLARWASTRT